MGHVVRASVIVLGVMLGATSTGLAVPAPQGKAPASWFGASLHQTASTTEADAALETTINGIVARIQNGDLTTARRLIDEALAASPDSGDLWRLSAQLELLRGQTQSAEQQFDRAVAENNDDFFSRILRAVARLANRPDQDDAITRDLAGFRAYPLVDRALQLMQEGRYDEAREFLDRAIEVDPDNVVVWTVSGDLETRRGNLETATEHLDRAVALDPQYARARLYRGFLYIQSGEYAAGRDSLSRALLLGGLTDSESQVARETLLSIGGTPPVTAADAAPDVDGQVMTADELRAGANDAAQNGNALLAYNMLAALSAPTLEDRLLRSDYALSAGEYAAAMADLRYVAESAEATEAMRRDANIRQAYIHHANGRFADARDALLTADDYALLDVEELRFLVRLTREVGPPAMLQSALGDLQRRGMGEERAWAADELFQLQLASGNRNGARQTYEALTEDDQVSVQARANALTRLGALAEEDGDTELANARYAAAAALTETPPRVVAAVDEPTPQVTTPPVTTRPTTTTTPSPRPTPPATTPRAPVRRVSAADRAYALAQDGRCADALPLFVEAYRQSGDGSLLVAQAYCHSALGDRDAAITSFQQASNADDLSAAQELDVWKSLAYLYEADQDWVAAEGAWRRASAMQPTAESQYGIGRALRMQDRWDDALAVWRGVDPADLPDDQRENFQREVADTSIALAYAHVNAGRDAEAIPLFQQAIAAEPSRYYGAREDLGYAYMREGRYDDAARTFRSVVDNADQYPQTTEAERQALAARLYGVRRTITDLERDWYAFGGLTYRSGLTRATPGFAQGNSGQSQAAFEAGWFPSGQGYNVGSGIALYGRVFGSFEDDSLNFLDETLQGGVGIHYKPFDDLGLILTAERMIKIGDDARNAWLLVAAYSWSQGTDWQPGRDHWRYTNAYGELAYIPTAPEFFSASGEVLHGMAFPIGNQTVLIPHGVVAGRYSEDDFQRTSYLETGPGVSFRHWFGGDAYHAPRGTAELQLQYRFMVADGSNPDISNNGAFIARLVFSY